jgi:hypothetical protein
MYQLRWNTILTVPCTHFGICFAKGAFCLWHFTTKGTGKEHLSNIKALCRSLPFPSGHPIVHLYLLFHVKTDTAIILHTKLEIKMDAARSTAYDVDKLSRWFQEPYFARVHKKIIVGLLTRIWHGKPRTRTSITRRGKVVPLFQSVQTGCGAHPPFCSMDPVVSFFRG